MQPSESGGPLLHALDITPPPPPPPPRRRDRVDDASAPALVIYKPLPGPYQHAHA